jgi:hypothetical protein
MLGGVSRATFILVAPVLAAAMHQALAEELSPDEPNGPAALERRLKQTEQALRELTEKTVILQQQVDADHRALDAYRKKSDAALEQSAGRGPAPGEPTGPVGEAPEQPNTPPATAQIFNEPTALTPRGKLVVEPSVQYIHSTNNEVALVGYTVLPAITIGLINIQRVELDTENYALTARYGITPRIEFDLKAPYVTSSQSTETRPLATASTADTFFNASGSGVGDVSAALRAQLNHFRGDNVVWIASLQYKSDTGHSVFQEPIDANTGLQTGLATGSGFNAIQPGITWLFPSDPAVFFGGVAYTHSFSRNVGHGYGDVNPGGILDLNVGMGLAINERASFSFGYQQSIVHQTTQEDSQAQGYALARTGTLQLGTLRLGVSYLLTERFNLNFTLGFGVTRDAPDLELTVRLPMIF